MEYIISREECAFVPNKLTPKSRSFFFLLSALDDLTKTNKSDYARRVQKDEKERKKGGKKGGGGGGTFVSPSKIIVSFECSTQKGTTALLL